MIPMVGTDFKIMREQRAKRLNPWQERAYLKRRGSGDSGAWPATGRKGRP
jgi:hypothetical protein